MRYASSTRYTRRCDRGRSPPRPAQLTKRGNGGLTDPNRWVLHTHRTSGLFSDLDTPVLNYAARPQRGPRVVPVSRHDSTLWSGGWQGFECPGDWLSSMRGISPVISAFTRTPGRA